MLFPEEIKNKVSAKFWGTKKECYGIFKSGLSKFIITLGLGATVVLNYDREIYCRGSVNPSKEVII